MIELLFGVTLGLAAPLAIGLVATVTWAAVRAALAAIALLMVTPAIMALVLPRGGAAAVLVLPWLGLTIALGLSVLCWVLPSLLAGRGRIDPWRLGVVAAVGFLAVGATWAVIDRAGLQPFGFGRTIVLLTAVHFHVAGFVLTLAGALAARARPGRATSAALAALVVGMPLTALGFFGLPVVSWIGAMLVSAAGIGIGAATIAIGRRAPDRIARAGLLVGGATLFLTMPLATAYATGATFGIGFLDIPAMAAIHGGLNVVGFAIPTMAGWSRLDR